MDGISTPDNRPESLEECYKDGILDMNLLVEHWDREDDESDAFLKALRDDKSDSNDRRTPKHKRKRKRSARNVKFEAFDAQGNRIKADARYSSWHQWYVEPLFTEHPNLDKPKFHKKFRRRFRLPYQSFVELVEIAKTAKDKDGNLYFRRWLSKDATGKPSSPLGLMILGSLRYLGRGWTFDDVEESTCIDEETHRQFFEVFIAFGSEFLYPKWVVFPTDAEAAEEHMHEFKQAGFHGAMGSSDATHIMLERCFYAQRQAHIGFKMTHPARTYNMTVNHRRRILHTTPGHPARWNDKTVVLFDDFIRGIHEGKYLSDVEFELYEKDDNGAVFSVKYRGAWVLVDNGYLAWSTTIPPMKKTFIQNEIRWSQWLESMRKDVECTFGILKGRWRILKAGVRVHGVEKCDQIWLTCCALHNWLLDTDGLDKRWEAGVNSEWEGRLGNHSTRDVQEFMPDAIRRMHHLPTSRGYDTSGMGQGPDILNDAEALNRLRQQEQEWATAAEDNAEENAAGDDGVRIVRKLPIRFFRKKLVEHFHILWQQHDIQWPSRNGVSRPTYP
jgi:hypothetical protein